jgi:ketosteroid isomerase-like protein
MTLKNLYIPCLSLVLFSSCFINKSGQKSLMFVTKKKHTLMSTLDDEHLLARITATEDRLEILNLLAGSAFSSDVASEAYWMNMFTEDAVFDRGQGQQDKGREEILKIVSGSDQREAIEFGMTHLAMLPHITLKGDSAVATGYLLIVMPDTAASHVKLPGKGVSPGFSIYQLTVNRWELVRTTTGWKVTRRTVRPITSNESRNILDRAIEDSR